MPLLSTSRRTSNIDLRLKCDKIIRISCVETRGSSVVAEHGAILAAPSIDPAPHHVSAAPGAPEPTELRLGSPSAIVQPETVCRMIIMAEKRSGQRVLHTYILSRVCFRRHSTNVRTKKIHDDIEYDFIITSGSNDQGLERVAS